MYNTNLPPNVAWAPWIILAVILVCATAVIIVTVLRPTRQTGKLQQTIIAVLVSLFSSVGGYLARTPQTRHYLDNAHTALEAFEKTENELLRDRDNAYKALDAFEEKVDELLLRVNAFSS